MNHSYQKVKGNKMRYLIIAVMSLALASCIHVTIQSQPPEEWMETWSACNVDPACDTNDIRPWYGLPPTDGTGTRVGI